MKALLIASQNVRLLLVAAALAVGASACGSKDGNTTGTAGTGGGGACNVPEIFNFYACATPACHGSATPAAAFGMETAGWETMMVGKVAPGGGPTSTASMCGGMNQVYLVAGSQPATGLFMDKLKNMMPACGKRMPNIGGPLTSTEIACVQAWADNLTKPK